MDAPVLFEEVINIWSDYSMLHLAKCTNSTEDMTIFLISPITTGIELHFLLHCLYFYICWAEQTRWSSICTTKNVGIKQQNTDLVQSCVCLSYKDPQESE